MVSDFCKTRCNVYRTKHFIVIQDISIQFDAVEDNVLVSKDTYISRNIIRDCMYRSAYGKKKNIDGKRIPTSMFTRKYIE